MPAKSQHLKLFGSKTEVIFAYADGAVTTHERIRLANPDFGTQDRITAMPTSKVIETTVGRVIFSEIWPTKWASRTRSSARAELGDLIWKCYKICGHEKTVIMLDKLKELGFREATKAGVSIGIDDMIIPKEKDQEIDTAQKQINEVEKQYRKGVITPGERYNKIIDIWTHCTDQIANVMLRTLETQPGQEGIQPCLADGGFRRAR